MKKIALKSLHIIVAFVMICLLIAGSVYTLALTVKPVRAALTGTALERFLTAAEEEHIPTEMAAVPGQVQAIEIPLSPTAAKNIGLDDSAIAAVKVTDYYKSFSCPAEVIERPGFSTITVPAPASGVVTKIYHESGVAIEPGKPLFDITLNQQELIKNQTEFLELLHKREINTAEIERLSGLDPQMIPKQRRDLEYEKLHIDEEIATLKNVLLIQGLSKTDIEESLEKNSTIINKMTVYAPHFGDETHADSVDHADGEKHIYTVDELFSSTGNNVTIGDSLCRLTDYSKLVIQGKVFAINESMLEQALTAKSRVSATFEGMGSRKTVNDLEIRSIDNKINTVNGTLFCYIDLKNSFTSREVNGENTLRRYVQWHFKPGQRCELNIEVEPLPNCIVLPVDAVAKDIQETCVFEWVGNEEDSKIWRKKPVHVIYQTKDAAVLANDGALFPGAKIAIKGANIILAALDAANQKTAGGGGIQHGDHVH